MKFYNGLKIFKISFMTILSLGFILSVSSCSKNPKSDQTKNSTEDSNDAKEKENEETDSTEKSVESIRSSLDQSKGEVDSESKFESLDEKSFSLKCEKEFYFPKFDSSQYKCNVLYKNIPIISEHYDLIVGELYRIRDETARKILYQKDHIVTKDIEESNDLWYGIGKIEQDSLSFRIIISTIEGRRFKITFKKGVDVFVFAGLIKDYLDPSQKPTVREFEKSPSNDTRPVTLDPYVSNCITEGSAGSETHIISTIQHGGFITLSETDWRARYKFQIESFEDASCTKLMSTGNFELMEDDDTTGLATILDYNCATPLSASMTIHSESYAAEANASNMGGFSDWQVGVKKDVKNELKPYNCFYSIQAHSAWYISELYTFESKEAVDTKIKNMSPIDFPLIRHEK